MIRSSSARRLLAACLAILAVSGAGFGLWLWRVDRRKTASLKVSTGTLTATVQSRERHRPILHGRPEEGNAWADYRRAFQELSKIEHRAEKLVQLQLLQLDD